MMGFHRGLGASPMAGSRPNRVDFAPDLSEIGWNWVELGGFRVDFDGFQPISTVPESPDGCGPLDFGQISPYPAVGPGPRPRSRTAPNASQLGSEAHM